MKHYVRSLVLIILVTGCVTTKIHQIKPLEPSLTYLLYPKKVDSLSPTFKWEASIESGVKYDFAIYTTQGYFYRNVWIQGERVYYKEGIENTEHKVEIKLLPKTVYLWSVRVRKEDTVLPWSYLNFGSNATLSLGNFKGHNVLFSFKTPK